MTTLTYRRLRPSLDDDRDEWRRVFRGAPSFTHATEGRPPTDADADRMLDTVPDDKTGEDVFLYAIYVDSQLCGCAYVARDYPKKSDAYLVLLVLMEQHQRSYLGIRCLSWVEEQARAWGCEKLRGVVDATNDRALRFWERLGFHEERRQSLSGLIGQAIVGYIPINSQRNAGRSSTDRLRRTTSIPRVE